MKKIFTLFILGVGILFFPATGLAHENEELVFDLDSTTIRSESSYIDDSGETIELMIENISSGTRVGKGTYKVSKKSTGNWLVSYNVTVNSNKQFTDATNLNMTTYQGSITSSSLSSNSSRAICNFKHKIGTMTSNASVTTTISNGKLVVK
ncbi:hypothetical protein FQS88_18595 [Enterococcus casseliflavus]|nr:hypothetical protein [Enterococcus casseliflavus]